MSSGSWCVRAPFEGVKSIPACRVTSVKTIDGWSEGRFRAALSNTCGLRFEFDCEHAVVNPARAPTPESSISRRVIVLTPPRVLPQASSLWAVYLKTPLGRALARGETLPRGLK